MSDLDLDIQLEPDGFVDSPIQGSPLENFVILLTQRVLEQIKGHVEPHLTNEVGGLLLGEVWENNDITYVEIKEIVPSQTKGTYATLPFSVDTWLELEQQRERLFPQYKKVGWYHSHLGCGVFLSSLDKTLHELAFSLPWHVALVYDPILSEYGVFHWGESSKLVPAPFYITPERNIFKETPLSHTIGHQLHVLSSFLEGLEVETALTLASRHIQSRLEEVSAKKRPTSSPVEEILNTVVEIAEIDPQALRQAKRVIAHLLGHQLILGRNVRLATTAVFDTDQLAIAQDTVYCVDEKILSWFPLQHEDQLSAVSLTTPLLDITANATAVFLLGDAGIIYIAPYPALQQFAEDEKSNQQTGASSSLSLKTIPINPYHDEFPHLIAVRGNTLYLAATSTVWIVHFEDDLVHFSTTVFTLAHLKGAFPLEINSLAVDEDENIYLSDVTNGRVLLMRPDGKIKHVFLGDRKYPFVNPISLVVGQEELFVLDIQRILVYNTVEGKNYKRHYTWAKFVGDQVIQKMYIDESLRVYFSTTDEESIYHLYCLDELPDA